MVITYISHQDHISNHTHTHKTQYTVLRLCTKSLSLLQFIPVYSISHVSLALASPCLVMSLNCPLCSITFSRTSCRCTESFTMSAYSVMSFIHCSAMSLTTFKSFRYVWIRTYSGSVRHERTGRRSQLVPTLRLWKRRWDRDPTRSWSLGLSGRTWGMRGFPVVHSAGESVWSSLSATAQRSRAGTSSSHREKMTSSSVIYQRWRIWLSIIFSAIL